MYTFFKLFPNFINLCEWQNKIERYFHVLYGVVQEYMEVEEEIVLH